MNKPKLTHELRIPENDRCICHDEPGCWWDCATRMWYHADGTALGRWENWPDDNELFMWACDEPPEDGVTTVLYGGEVLPGYFDDGSDDVDEDGYAWHHDEFFIAPDACLAVLADEIPEGWLHELPA